MSREEGQIQRKESTQIAQIDFESVPQCGRHTGEEVPRTPGEGERERETRELQTLERLAHPGECPVDQLETQ